METITLQLRARHFKDARFIDDQNCPIAHAASEYFKIPRSRLTEGVDDLSIYSQNLWSEKRKFKHESYRASDHDFDKRLAIKHNFDDTVIREIVLNEVTV